MEIHSGNGIELQTYMERSIFKSVTQPQKAWVGGIVVVVIVVTKYQRSLKVIEFITGTGPTF